MYPFPSWFSRLGTGFSGWLRKAFLSASRDAPGGVPGPDDFDTYPSRAARYTLNWALYENTAYDNIHRYAHQHKVDYNLYPAIRNILNPAARIGDFWATHLYGGALDENAGDGTVARSAIPILDATDHERTAIARLWADSNWGQAKDVYAGIGARLGDVALKLEDYPSDSHLCLRVVDPRTLTDYREDDRGRCVAYQIERWVHDPRSGAAAVNSAATSLPPKVVYREVAVLQDGEVHYSTYLGAELYPWNGRNASWTESYSEIPLFLTAHNKILPDSPFGFSAIWPFLSKIRELDGLASRFSDYVAKSVDAPWLFAGVHPSSQASIPRTARTAGNSQPKMAEMPALYGGPEARAQALIANLDSAGVLAYMAAIQEEIKDDAPESRKDIESAIGDASGKALTVARQRLEAKAQSVRAGYDHVLTKAMKLALKIGAERGYPDYVGGGAGGDGEGDSTATRPSASTSGWRIGHRSVFEAAPMDTLELDEAFWKVAESADRAGCPLPGYLESKGWPAEKIAIVIKAQDDYLDRGLEVGRSKAQAPVNGDAAAMAVQTPNGVVK